MPSQTFIFKSTISPSNSITSRLHLFSEDEITATQALERLKTGVSIWCAATASGQTVLAYSGHQPNIGDLASHFESDLELANILRQQGIQIDTTGEMDVETDAPLNWCMPLIHTHSENAIEIYDAKSKKLIGELHKAEILLVTKESLARATQSGTKLTHDALELAPYSDNFDHQTFCTVTLPFHGDLFTVIQTKPDSAREFTPADVARNELYHAARKTAVKFLRFYGLVEKDRVAAGWDTNKRTLKNINDELFGQHEEGLGALAMAFSLYANHAEVRDGRLSIGLSNKHWYIAFAPAHSLYPDVFWDTTIATESACIEAVNTPSYQPETHKTEIPLHEATKSILNGLERHQAILYQWLSLSLPHIEHATTGDDMRDLLSMLYSITQDDRYIGLMNFKHNMNSECIYSKRRKVVLPE